MTALQRLITLFLLNAVACLTLGELNHFLTPYGVNLHVDALYVVFVALFIHETRGLIPVLLIAALMEGRTPTPPGAYLIGYAAMWTLFVGFRMRIQRYHADHLSLLAVAGNSLFILYLSLLHSRGHVSLPAYWSSIFVELLISSAVLFLFVPFWCRVQKSALLRIGWDPGQQLNTP